MSRLRRALQARRRRQRFNCQDQNSPAWEDRAERAVGLLAGSAVVSCGEPLKIADLGAGNQRLRPILERTLGVPSHYRAYDLRPQAVSVERLDVERELPEEHFDVVFCLGLLEYLRDLDGFVRRLRTICRYAVVSYVITDPPDSLDSSARRDRGWRTDLNRSGLERLFGSNGYRQEAFALVTAGHIGLWLWATSEDAAVPGA